MKSCAAGFTLIEMAIVFLLVTLLLGGMLIPLSTQIEQRRIGETQKALDEIKEALIGYAVVNGRLPRPAQSATNGAERAACGAGAAGEANCTGFIPWETLGVRKLDAWGKIVRYSVTPAYADAAFGFGTAGTKTVQTRNPALVNLATNAPAVIYSHGNGNWGTGDSGNAFADGSATNADEDSNNGATTSFISRTPTENAAAAGGEFDDVVTWLSPNILFSRMVAAGKLP